MSAYPRTELEELLKCKACKMKFTHTDEPKSLPCGHTICNACDDSIDSKMKCIDHMFDNELKCIKTFKCLVRSCKKEHKKPLEGFPVNQLAIKLVSLQPKEIYRGDNIESLKSHLNTIELLLSRIATVADSGEIKINEYFAPLKVQLRQAIDNRIKEINELNDVLMRQIESYENDCFQRFSSACSQNEVKFLEIKTFLEHKKSYLIERLDNKNTNLIVKSNKKATKFIKKLEQEEIFLKNCIFNNKLVEFEPNKSKLDVNWIGTVNCRAMIQPSQTQKDPKGYKKIKTLSGHTDWVIGMSVLSESHLASFSLDNTIKIWNTNTGDLAHTLSGHTNAVDHLVVLKNGSLASYSLDNTIKVWNTNTGHLIQSYSRPANTDDHLVILSSGFLAISSTDNNIKICNMSEDNVKYVLNGHKGLVTCLVVLDTESDRLASSSFDQTIKIWNTQDGSLIKTLRGHTNAVDDLTVLNNDHLASTSLDQTIKIWDVTDGCLIQTLSGHSTNMAGLAILNNGCLVTSSRDNNMLKIWDTKTNELIRTLTGHLSEISDLVVMNNGFLASCSWDHTIKVWNPNTGELVRSLSGHTKSISGLCVLKNDFLVSSSRDNTLKIWGSNCI